jgi:hypothetical protein
MIRRRFLTVSRTNGAHTNSSMPDLNKQANKGIPPVLFRGRLRVPRGLCLCVTCQTSFGGTRTGHADHHVETNGVKLFVGLEFVLTPHRTWAQAQAQAHCRSSLRAVCVQGSVLYLLHYARRRRHQAAYSAVQRSTRCTKPPGSRPPGIPSPVRTRVDVIGEGQRRDER